MDSSRNEKRSTSASENGYYDERLCMSWHVREHNGKSIVLDIVRQVYAADMQKDLPGGHNSSSINDSRSIRHVYAADMQKNIPGGHNSSPINDMQRDLRMLVVDPNTHLNVLPKGANLPYD
jgi:hypothetical protein